jgi:NAD(P)H-hydrate repair Nnr-like enzyme with NAD(P)H-hydrate epimerase domain
MTVSQVSHNLGLPVFSVAQIRAAEERAFLVTAPGSLMQRAAFALGVGCADLLQETFGCVYGTSVLVVVGPGNNGGDALFAGALLARRGVSVGIYCVVPGVCHEAGLSAVLGAGGRVIDSLAGEFDLVLDGIAGLGSSRPVDGELARFINFSPLVVAVDIPSGVNADTGVCDADACIHADVTFTFGALKPGLVLAPGAAFTGAIEVVDLDLEFDSDPVLRVLGDYEVAELNRCRLTKLSRCGHVECFGCAAQWRWHGHVARGIC